MAGSSNSGDEWTVVASGLLVCVATICISYLVLRLWPRAHYPRLFALLAGVAAVSAMYIYSVPGAGFGLGALALMAYIMAHASEAWEALFAKPDATPPSKKARAAASTETAPPIKGSRGQTSILGALGFLTFGGLLGLGLALAAVSAVVVPPAYLKAWIFHPDGLADRVRRGIEPGKEFADLQIRERAASEAAKRTEAELVIARKRAEDAETALSKVQDELGVATSNTVRSVRIEVKNGSRHAGGAVYVGVSSSVLSESFCNVRVSGDKQENTQKYLYVGESIPVLSSKGRYRVVLVALDGKSCTFDVVKD